MGYHVRVKICGVTTPDDGRLVAAAGADAIGLNFYPKSPRCVDQASAAAILSVLPPFMEAVGVFASESASSMVARTRQLSRIRSIQAHGGWTEPGEVAPYPLILAVAVADATSLAELTEYLRRCGDAGLAPAAVLLDAKVAGQFGGTGRTAPWDLLADFRPDVPLIMAGGLTPENVAEAVRLVRPYAVDVASGVEQAPGRKDADRIRRFIENARSAAANLPG